MSTAKPSSLIAVLLKLVAKREEKEKIGIPLSQMIKSTAECFVKSETLIKKISKEHTIRLEQGSGDKLSTPGKKRSMWCENTELYVNSFDRYVIRNIMIFVTKKSSFHSCKTSVCGGEKLLFCERCLENL